MDVNANKEWEHFATIGNQFFIWDSRQVKAEGKQEKCTRWSIQKSIPKHNTDSRNYLQFINEIEAFFAEVKTTFPEEAHLTQYDIKENGIKINTMPAMFFGHVAIAVNGFVIESAVANNLSIYELSRNYPIFLADNQGNRIRFRKMELPRNCCVT